MVIILQTNNYIDYIKQDMMQIFYTFMLFGIWIKYIWFYFLAICQLPPEVGSCKGRFPRWFYNTSSSQCELFIYGGCYGNKNQFHNLNECNELCGELYIVVITIHSQINT